MSPSPETEALFSSAREALAPTEADRERNLAALAARLGADALGVAVGATGVTAATGAKALATKTSLLGHAGAASSWSSLTLKIVFLAIAIAALPVVAILVRASSSRTSNKTPTSRVATGSPTVIASSNADSETRPAEQPEPVALLDDTARHDAPSDEPSLTVDKARSATRRRKPETGAPPNTARRVGVSSAPVKTPMPTEESAPGDTSASRALHDEVELVERIHGAQRAGDTATVHALVAEHARRFPSGMLGEECAAADTMAYCSTDAPDAARARAEGFRRRYASSPLVSRVRKTCEK